MNKVKRISDFDLSPEYVGISVVFFFSPKSNYSKLSDGYNDGERVTLADRVKEDAVKKIDTLFKDNKDGITYNWFDSETEHLTAYPSVLEIGGYGISHDGAEVNEKKLGKLAKELNKEISDRMGKETSCFVNFYVIRKGGVVLANNFRTK